MRKALPVFMMLLFSGAAMAAVQQAQVLLLSSNVASEGIGEWGFAALIEADGRKILLDTGARPDTVLLNARIMGVDLSAVTDVVLSHSHDDHTGGLLALRKAYSRKQPAALGRVHVAESCLERAAALSTEYGAAGGKLMVHKEPAQVAPGVWLTGPIPRPNPERNYSGSDTVADDQALVLDTAAGLIVVTGCCHAGVINTLEYARTIVPNRPIFAVVGGFHLLAADDKTLDWTGGKLHELGVTYLMGSHCTGLEALYRLRQAAGLDRAHAVVGATGAIVSTKGMEPGPLAR